MDEKIHRDIKRPEGDEEKRFISGIQYVLDYVDKKIKKGQTHG